LNILVIYWVKPPDYWLFLEISENINREILKQFNAENIEFAFPTQTIHLERENQE
jgi:small-conductance mechanosensitive channel